MHNACLQDCSTMIIVLDMSLRFSTNRAKVWQWTMNVVAVGCVLAHVQLYLYLPVSDSHIDEIMQLI